MPPKGKKGSKKGNDGGKNAEREAQLERENKVLTEKVNNIKEKVYQLRRYKESLQDEIDKINRETEDYVAYMAEKTQKHENAIAALNEQMHKKLEELSQHREEMIEEHERLVNARKKELLDLENAVAQKGFDLAALEDLKRLQRQQQDRIAELEQEVVTTRCHYFETLNALKANSIREIQQHKAESKLRVQEHVMKINKEVPLWMHSYIQQVTGENTHLQKKLQQLMKKAEVLRRHLQFLQAQNKELLLQKELQEMQCQRASTAQESVSTTTKKRQKEQHGEKRSLECPGVVELAETAKAESHKTAQEPNEDSSELLETTPATQIQE